MVKETERGELGKQLFCKGCNCSQAVVLAYKDIIGLDESTILKMASSFGGGMGRLREVCGTVSGMFIVAGLIFGYDDLTDPRLKSEHYKLIQSLAAKFKEINGSIICRELLGLEKPEGTYIPEARTAEYYKKRPCPELVKCAVNILEEYRNGKTS